MHVMPDDLDLARLEELIASATEGPWMVFVDRPQGSTMFSVATHTRAAIAISSHYWTDESKVESDSDGYLQPNADADIAEHRVATARLIAEMRNALPALLTLAREAETLRATNRRLNRRVQIAESALAEKASGPSLGRALANWAGAHWMERAQKAEAALATLSKESE